MKRNLLPALGLLAGMAHAETTIRVDVVTDPATHQTQVSTRTFDAPVGHTFTDPSHITAYLTGTVGKAESLLDVQYSGDGWRYFATASADGSSLPLAEMDRHVAGAGHINEHFGITLSRTWLQAHASQDTSINVLGASGAITFKLPAVFVHDYLEELDKALGDQVTQVVASARLHFGAEYVPVAAGFAQILGLPAAQGLLITTVQADGVAARAGLQQGDVLMEFGNRQLNSADDLEQAIAATAAGATVALKIWHAGAAATRPATF